MSVPYFSIALNLSWDFLQILFCSIIPLITTEEGEPKVGSEWHDKDTKDTTGIQVLIQISLLGLVDWDVYLSIKTL